MKTVRVKRLKDLERENDRLKTAVAEPTLDKQILKEALERNIQHHPLTLIMSMTTLKEK
jgi:hypothetical protein